jgi:drug/metabolite transporter (DMT)-like permease
MSGLLFAAMAVVAKVVAAHGMPGPQIACVRFVVGCVVCLAAAVKRPFRVSNWRGLAVRGTFGGAAVLCFFLGIEHLPVGEATLLNYTSPVFTAVFAAMFLGEALTFGAIAALVVTTVGVVLVVRGNSPAGASFGFGRWELVGVLGSVLSGAAVTAIRWVRRTDGSWEVLFAFCAVGAVINAVPAAQNWVTPTSWEWLLLLVVGGLAVGGQLLMTYALRYVAAAPAGILGQIVPVGALVFGWMFLGERIAGVALVGAAVTLAGVSWGAWKATVAVPEEG